MPCDYSNHVANPQAHVGGLLGKSQKTKLHPSLGNIHKGGHLLRRFRVQNKGDNPGHLVSSLDQKGCLGLPLKPRGPHSSCPGANPLLRGCLSTESDKLQTEATPEIPLFHRGLLVLFSAQPRVYFSSYFCLNWRKFS